MVLTRNFPGHRRPASRVKSTIARHQRLAGSIASGGISSRSRSRGSTHEVSISGTRLDAAPRKPAHWSGP